MIDIRIQPEDPGIIKVFKTAQRQLLMSVRDALLAQPDLTQPDVLRIAITVMEFAGFEQKELAELVGASRTTVGRWREGTNIPRAPGYRKWIVETCINRLVASLDAK